MVKVVQTDLERPITEDQIGVPVLPESREASTIVIAELSSLGKINICFVGILCNLVFVFNGARLEHIAADPCKPESVGEVGTVSLDIL